MSAEVREVIVQKELSILPQKAILQSKEAFRLER